MKKGTLYMLIIIIFQLFTNCKCDGSFFAKSYIINNASNDIDFLFIDKTSGEVVKTIVLKKNEKLQLGEYGGRSKSNVKAFPNLLLTTDSLVVNFNNKKYFYDVNRININKIPFDDSRNVLNELNYKRTIIEETKCFLQSEDIFTFTDVYFESLN